MGDLGIYGVAVRAWYKERAIACYLRPPVR
jgi:hypothetical protein